MKRVLLIGANGSIGRAVKKLLQNDYELICGGSSDEVKLDLTDAAGLVRVLKELAPLDAIISTAGRANFAPLDSVTVAPLEDSSYFLGLKDKLMGQVNLALAAREVLVPGGSITLTSGTTSDEPIIGGSSLSMVNGALEAWVRAAATELPNGLRLNLVSPSLIEGTSEQGIKAFPGFPIIDGHSVALRYLRCLESRITGQTLRI